MFFLFATAHGMTHLALPPFGPGSIESAAAIAFETMALINPPHVLSRIDNVDEPSALLLSHARFSVARASSDYLYCRDEIVNLSGRRFHAQRSAVNQAARFTPALRPFTQSDRPHCLAIFDQWVAASFVDSETSLNRMMREDARFAHHTAMNGYTDLGLTGRVVEVENAVVGYTFGFPISHDTFCVLLEITNRSVQGLSAWLFRAFCQERTSFTFINTMDDSGLSRLQQAKTLWHPVRMIPSYTVTLKG